ncbi:MAG: tetratricopeptide repeat protein [Acidobacteriota bacterium]
MILLRIAHRWFAILLKRGPVAVVFLMAPAFWAGLPCEEALQKYLAKEYASAAALAGQAVDKDGDDPACRHIYGLSLAALGKFSDAETNLQRAIALRPNHADYQYDLGYVLYQQKKYDQCVPVLKRAVELNGDNLMARFLLGRSYVSSHRTLLLGNFSQLALEQFRYIATKNPRFPTVHYHIAEIHSNNGFFEEAQRELNLELENFPASAQSRVALGELLLKTGQPEAALRELLLAEKHAPTIPLVHYTLAKAYRDNQDSDAALRSARRSLELDPGYADAHYLLGQLYQESGQTELARREMELFEKYRSTGP